MPLEQHHIAQILPGLKGAQLSVLFAYLFSPPRSTYGTNDLASLTGYTRTSISQALQSLQLKGLLQQLGRYESWILSSDAQQLFLIPKTELNIENGEYQNLILAPSSSSSTYLLLREEDLNLKKGEKTTTTTPSGTQSEDQILTLPLNDDYMQEIVQYFQQNGITRKSYQNALLNTLNAGWSTLRINTAFRLWQRFAEDSTRHIHTPPFYIIARFRDLDPPPINESTPCLYCTNPYEQYFHSGPICPECGGCTTCCTCNQDENETQEDTNA